MTEIPMFKQPSWRSVLISSSLSMVASRLAATKFAAAWITLTGLMYMPHNQVANAITYTFLAHMVKPIVKVSKVPKHTVAAHKTHIRIVSPAAIIITEPIASHKLFLHSFEKQYTCIFTGKVTCGGGPCHVAQVEVHMASRKNPNIVKTTTLQPDGNYQLSVLLTEDLHEHIDWWIVVDSPESEATQVQGRQILMEDSTINIEEPIRLL